MAIATIALKDFEADFDDKEYVERLARVDTNVNLGPLKKPEEFSPDALLKSFQDNIDVLNQLKNKNQKKVDKVEKQCYIIAKEHEDNLKQQRVVFQDTFRTHEHLELKVRTMAAKVVHLGDQLETANRKKHRTEEALQLIKYFNIFQRNEENETKLFAVSNSAQVFEAAKVVHILSSFATDLPDKYTEVRCRIEAKSRETERRLLQEFSRAHGQNNTARMRECGQSLAPFQKSYEICITDFINEATKIDPKTKITIFNQVTQLCHKTQKVILETFDNPEQVTGAFVAAVFDKIIKTHVREKLKDINKDTEIDEYLSKLSDLYDKATRLGLKLVEYEMIQDFPTATKQIKSLFHDYLNNYADEEIQNFRTKGKTELEEYYKALFDSTGMQKKVNTTPSGGYRPRRETIRNVTVDVLFVSQDFITNILTATKECINRCKVLCNPTELSPTVKSIYEIMMELICKDHLDYAVNLSLTVMKSSESKAPPNGLFFTLIKMINLNYHLVENQFRETMLPCISISTEYSACVKFKNEITASLDRNIEEGLDKYISYILGYLRMILTTEQKRSDYKVEDSEASPNLSLTPACQKSTVYLHSILVSIKENIDGPNKKMVLTELGLRFHRLLMEHMQQYVYTYTGAIKVLCDVTEYRKVIEFFEIPTLLNIMEATHMLCNLLIVPPENLKQVATDAQLTTGTLDKNVVMSFIQLRSDYKSKLGKNFVL